MLTPALILEVINNAILLATKIVESIPKEQHAVFWERHNKRVEFLEKLFERPPKQPPAKRRRR